MGVTLTLIDQQEAARCYLTALALNDKASHIWSVWGYGSHIRGAGDTQISHFFTLHGACTC